MKWKIPNIHKKLIKIAEALSEEFRFVTKNVSREFQIVDNLVAKGVDLRSHYAQ